MLIIGESINGTIPRVGQAMLDRDEAFIRELAKSQVHFGAQMLDVNAGIGEGNEIEDLVWAVEVVQKAVQVPLMIDSSSSRAIEAALSVYRNEARAIINSITLEKDKLSTLLAIIVESRSSVVALCMAEEGIPETVEGRIDVASRLYKKLTAANVSPADIYFDPLVLSVGTNPGASTITFQTLEWIKRHFPESHTICGVSNVGMGLPGRKLINRSFLVLAVAAGLDTILADVRDRALTSSLYAAKLLTDQDPYALSYINAFREQKLEA